MGDVIRKLERLRVGSEKLKKMVAFGCRGRTGNWRSEWKLEIFAGAS